ncbi:carbonic anhydrase-like [Euwallacea similis]|uniref:carbonic anhydrase-like n=1 Tax=Euwallacea similis TaxID=1736056 RepID=UPI00344F7BED
MNFSVMLKLSIFLKIIILSLDAAHFAAIAGETPHWDYKNQENWRGICQTGLSQSPINLDASSSLRYGIFFPLVVRNTGYFNDVVVVNNGHTVSVSLNCPNYAKPYISGAGLPGNYILDNIHFHWPSEHAINEKYYDLEAHLVFYNDRHPNLNSALLEPFAVSVVGILFQVCREIVKVENCNETNHENFMAISDAVQKVVRSVGQSVPATRGINVKDFFPNDIQKFFSYTGSLTTPPCTEHVIWFVMRDASQILGDDLAGISRIYTNEGEQLTCTNRNRQKRNGRSICIHDSN